MLLWARSEGSRSTLSYTWVEFIELLLEGSWSGMVWRGVVAGWSYRLVFASNLLRLRRFSPQSVWCTSMLVPLTSLGTWAKPSCIHRNLNLKMYRCPLRGELDAQRSSKCISPFALRDVLLRSRSLGAVDFCQSVLTGASVWAEIEFTKMSPKPLITF